MTAKLLTHKFASAIAEGTDPTLVGPNEWNSDHNFWLGSRVWSTGSADTLANTDHLCWVIYNTGSNIASNLPAPTTGPPATMPLGWTTKLKNIGGGIITLTPTGGATMNESSSPIALYQGDTAEIFSQGTVDYMVLVFRAAALLGAGFGGRLKYVSTTALSYLPFNGGYIRLNGVLRPIPATGNGIAGLANTSVFVNGVAAQNLVAGTTYLVFVFDNGGTLTADFRTDSTHAPSATPGNIGTEVKFVSSTEDPTRSLIGMVRTGVSTPTFVDDGTSNFGVATWLNRRPRFLPGQSIGNLTGINQTTPGFIPGSSGANVSTLIWGDSLPSLSLNGLFAGDTALMTILANIGINSVATNYAIGVSPRWAVPSGLVSTFTSIGATSGGGGPPANIIEGWNVFGCVGWVTTGNATYNLVISGMAFI